MSGAPVRYGDHPKIAADIACSVCGTATSDAVMDHCHAHGWVRGPACRRCNTAMALIDRGIAPGRVIESVPLSALLDHAHRCHECPPLTVADLITSGGLRGSPPPLNQPTPTEQEPAMTTDRASVLKRLRSHKTAVTDLADAVIEAKHLGIGITTIAETAGIARTRVYRILADSHEPTLRHIQTTGLVPRAVAPPLVDLPEDFLDHGPIPKGQVGWRCRYCGRGRMFLGTVREEAAEARSHEAQCPMNPARTATPDTEETP